MAYIRQTWEDAPSTNTPITADRLNHMEDGIYNADTTASSIVVPTALSDLTDDVGLTNKETTSNKTTTISNSSTNIEYPSALAVKTYVDDAISASITSALGGNY